MLELLNRYNIFIVNIFVNNASSIYVLIYTLKKLYSKQLSKYCTYDKEKKSCISMCPTIGRSFLLKR